MRVGAVNSMYSTQHSMYRYLAMMACPVLVIPHSFGVDSSSAGANHRKSRNRNG